MEPVKIIWNWLGDLSLLVWIICALLVIGGSLLYFWKYIKSQWRFGKNLRRTIYFLKTSDAKNLQTQKDKLKALNLFNVDEDIKDISQKLDVLQSLRDNAIYIVGYDGSYDYNDLFRKAENNNIPIIIYADAGEITEWSLFNNYIYCDVANTTNRVTIILLNILKII